MGLRIAGNRIFLQPAVNVVDTLPKGTYYVRYDKMTGYYLEMGIDFKLPNKIYGDLSIVDRWLKSYHNNSRNTGVLLSGTKGSGKTLLGKKLAIDSGLPIIIIDASYDDVDFLSFILSSEFGDVCIFIDEFEKLYDEVLIQK